jgi:hypothetical protein
MQITEQAIARLSSQHQSIRMYIDGLPARTLSKRYLDDASSIHEIIAYLCRYQYVSFERIVSMCRSLNPCFSAYNTENDPQFSFIAAKTTGCLLRELISFRGDMTAFVRGLPPEYGSRVGTHAVFGKMSLNEWLEFFLLHESRELFRIFRLACAIRTSECSGDTIFAMPWLQHKSG